MRPTNPIRLVMLSTLSLALGVAVALQSTGIALTRKAPETATMLFPLNGLAGESAASDIFSSRLAAGDAPQEAAWTAEKQARHSYRLEPLSPESHAILALAQKDSARRSEVIDAASRLNRRNKMLQALVLEERVLAEDYSGVLETLDQILRVRPSRSQDLYPVLLTVFAQEGAVEEFQKVLDGTSPWHEKFLTFAVSEPAALLNLAELRSQQNFDNENFDKALLRGLVREGQLKVAYSLYEQFGDGVGGIRGTGRLTWNSTYDPLDWRLTDGADYRAVPSLDSTDLELYVRPGHGGVFARRIIRAPDAPFSMSAEHQITPIASTERVSLSLTCMQARKPFYEAQFGETKLSFSIDELPADCPFIELALSARAWAGESAIKGTISSLEIR